MKCKECNQEDCVTKVETGEGEFFVKAAACDICGLFGYDIVGETPRECINCPKAEVVMPPGQPSTLTGDVTIAPLKKMLEEVQPMTKTIGEWSRKFDNDFAGLTTTTGWVDIGSTTTTDVLYIPTVFSTSATDTFNYTFSFDLGFDRGTKSEK